MPNNPFVHAELVTPDLAKAKEFYQSLFDWQYNDVMGGEYTIIDVGEHKYGVGGGMLTTPEPGIPPHWFPYVAVSDLEAATAKAKSLGATVVKDITKIEGSDSSFSIIMDPAGAVLGLYSGGDM